MMSHIIFPFQVRNPYTGEEITFSNWWGQIKCVRYPTTTLQSHIISKAQFTVQREKKHYTFLLIFIEQKYKQRSFPRFSSFSNWSISCFTNSESQYVERQVSRLARCQLHWQGILLAGSSPQSLLQLLVRQGLGLQAWRNRDDCTDQWDETLLHMQVAKLNPMLQDLLKKWLKI